MEMTSRPFSPIPPAEPGCEDNRLAVRGGARFSPRRWGRPSPLAAGGPSAHPYGKRPWTRRSGGPDLRTVLDRGPSTSTPRGNGTHELFFLELMGSVRWAAVFGTRANSVGGSRSRLPFLGSPCSPRSPRLRTLEVSRPLPLDRPRCRTHLERLRVRRPRRAP